MTKKLRQLVVAILTLAVCFGAVYAEEPTTEPEGGAPTAEIVDPYADLKLRVGIVYGEKALVAANLLNASVSPVTGYRFGYYDSDLNFIDLGGTEETALTMLKTTVIYRVGSNYYDNKPSGESEELGCYHLQLSTPFEDFNTAKELADTVPNGFVAWIDGVFYVRKDSFSTYAAVTEAVHTDELGEWTAVYTSVYAVNVVKTGTTEILFQFDGLETTPLGIMPGMADDGQAITWFKGYKYYGGFCYERINGGNLTVINIVPLDTYVKGVVPYESYKQWPLETLKAQALCAKNYGLINRGKHSGNHFDVCTTTDCQVYHGAGSGAVSPSELSDQSVDEIHGIYAWYNNKLAQTYFYSSNGGGSEDVSNVWGSNQATYPYLKGVVDIYEADIADKIPNYYFSNTFTKEKLTSILQPKGYGVGTTVENIEVIKYSDTGNVLTIRVTYANGKTNTFNTSNSGWLRNALGCRSIHFTITRNCGDSVADEYMVNNDSATVLKNLAGLYVMSGDGKISQLESNNPYVITGEGSVERTREGADPANDTFTVSGTGWGHSIGYSQWGGYAMALRGFTYDEIIEFYYPGVYVGPKAE